MSWKKCGRLFGGGECSQKRRTEPKFRKGKLGVYFSKSLRGRGSFYNGRRTGGPKRAR